jgi:hypothetical protein
MSSKNNRKYFYGGNKFTDAIKSTSTYVSDDCIKKTSKGSCMSGYRAVNKKGEKSTGGDYCCKSKNCVKGDDECQAHFFSDDSKAAQERRTIARKATIVILKGGQRSRSKSRSRNNRFKYNDQEGGGPRTGEYYLFFSSDELNTKLGNKKVDKIREEIKQGKIPDQDKLLASLLNSSYLLKKNAKVIKQGFFVEPKLYKFIYEKLIKNDPIARLVLKNENATKTDLDPIYQRKFSNLKTERHMIQLQNEVTFEHLKNEQNLCKFINENWPGNEKNIDTVIKLKLARIGKNQILDQSYCPLVKKSIIDKIDTKTLQLDLLNEQVIENLVTPEISKSMTLGLGGDETVQKGGGVIFLIFILIIASLFVYMMIQFLTADNQSYGEKMASRRGGQRSRQKSRNNKLRY